MSEAPGNDPTALTPAQLEALERGVAKIVALGGEVGVGPEKMIELLSAGLSVRELLDYLLSCRGGAA